MSVGRRFDYKSASGSTAPGMRGGKVADNQGAGFQPAQNAMASALTQAAIEHGMARIRVSTTVDQSLLDNARRLRSDLNDAALLDEALGALVARHRAAEIDDGYPAYDDHPLDEADDWADLSSFREAAAST